MTAVGLGGGRLASPRRDARSATAPVQGPPATPRHQTLDGRWDAQMTRVLREAAEVREERQRARANEDVSSAQHEAAALLCAIRARGRPNLKHYVSRRPWRRAPGPALGTS